MSVRSIQVRPVGRRAAAAAGALALGLVLTGCGGAASTAAAGATAKSPSGGSSTSSPPATSPSPSDSPSPSPTPLAGGQGPSAVKVAEGKGFCDAFNRLSATFKTDPKTPAEAVTLFHTAADALRSGGTPAMLVGDVAVVADSFDLLASEMQSGAIGLGSVNSVQQKLTPEYTKSIVAIVKWQATHCT